MTDTKILYVDDESINLKLFKINFGKKYNVLIAEDANEGLNILKSNPDIKVVISDMKMPDVNGIEFITSAKPLYPEISYYILTGYDIIEEIQNALNEKLIIKYFRKPFNRLELDSEIKSVIEKKYKNKIL